MVKSIYSIGLCFLLYHSNTFCQKLEHIHLKGKGWFQCGRIMHASDTVDGSYDYRGNWLQGNGAQFSVNANIGQNWEGALGLGGRLNYSAQSNVENSLYVNKIFEMYITRARFSYWRGVKALSPLLMTFGYFNYLYNKEMRTFGDYLLRGPVYPGLVFGSFESQHVDSTVANTLGIHLKSILLEGFLEQNAIIKSEIDFKPLFDISLIYTAQINFKGLQLQAGINFYRFLPIFPKSTKLETGNSFIEDASRLEHPFDIIHNYFLPDSNTGVIDTVRMSHRGTKLMFRAAIDPKTLLGFELFKPDDLLLYGELGVLGTRNDELIYTHISDRIPVTFGLYIPTYFFDECILELEYYKSPFKNDYYNLVNQNSPVPVSNADYRRERQEDGPYLMGSDSTVLFSDPVDINHLKKDDIKWSLYLAKYISQGVKISGCIANDHFRPNAFVPRKNTEHYETAFSTMRDWYIMIRISYFF